MMYQIKCDEHPLLDLRDEKLIVLNPKAKTEVNTVGEASFTIYNNHPYYGKLKKLKSIFEISDDFGVLFRGRMTDDSHDFYNGKAVDLEGLMAFFNDSVVPPYNFPEDFLEDADYIASENKVEFFLGWLINNHNSQVTEEQKFKLGVVTVSDPNNYITRSDTKISKTWDVIKSKLFESALGGYICIRYEADGNYIDYLSEFTLTNTQKIEFGKNLLGLKQQNDGSSTYSVVVPIGGEIEGEADEEGNVTKETLTLASVEDGAITEDVYKITLSNGLHAIYSKKAVEEYGWICAPVSETTWNDVTNVDNLLTKSTDYLTGTAVMLSDTVEFTAVDLHFTDEEIQSFRIYRKIQVESKPHGLSGSYNLTKLDIDLLNPQNTKIVVGESKLTMTDQSNKEHSNTIERIESAEKDIEENRTGVTEAKQMVLTESTSVINTCNEIILAALKSYVETGNFEEYKKTVETSLELLADEMSIKFSETISELENVNGDLKETITTLNKHFDFSLENGLVIKTGANQMQLQLDNDIIRFIKNGIQFGWWDGVDFHTGNIIVDLNERAQFGNFAFVPRSDGSLSFLKVRDYKEIAEMIGVLLKSADGYILKDLNGFYLTAKEGD